jgi:ABC transporter substrate binding protein
MMFGPALPSPHSKKTNDCKFLVRAKWPELWDAVGCLLSRTSLSLAFNGCNFAVIHRELIIKLANQYKLPAVYPLRLFAATGGLICYGPEAIEPHKRAAGYVDRILKGEKPADLPVQAPTKYELVINLKTAKALDLTIPPSLLARAASGQATAPPPITAMNSRRLIASPARLGTRHRSGSSQHWERGTEPE